MNKKIKVAIVGAGIFSNDHINVLQTIEGVEIIGICDQDFSRAEAVAKKIKGIRPYKSLDELLEKEKPTAAHILTPPETHARLAIQAMKAGCHVLVEKPMALSTTESQQMMEVAKDNNVKLSTDHNYLFNPCIKKALQIIRRGDIGKVVHVNAYYGMPGAASDYRGTAGRSHWAWYLPGSAFTNFYPHMIYLVAAALPGNLTVRGATLGQESLNEGLPTDLNVLINGENASANIQVSMRIQPYAKYIDFYGTKGIVHADLANEVCTFHKTHRVPGMISKVLFNLEEAIQLATGTILNTTKVLLRIMRNNPGLRNHLKEFYEALQNNSPIPVTGEDGHKMVGIMEETWNLLPKSIANPKNINRIEHLDPKTQIEKKIAETKALGTVLITGASGFLGSFLAKALTRSGVKVRVLVRDNRISRDILERCETVQGDIRDYSSVLSAMQGVSTVFHCAAVTRNFLPLKTHEDVNVLGTENILKAAQASKGVRVIHMSSVIVYGLSDGKVDEESPYAVVTDPYANYMRTKIEADKLALSYHRDHGLPVTVLRLGGLYGPVAGAPFNRGLIQLGPFKAFIGSGRNYVPNLHIENAVECCLLASISSQAIGQSYNVVDEPQITSREFFKKCDEILGERTIRVSIPEFLMNIGAQIFEWQFGNKAEHIPPRLSRFVVRSTCRNIYYSTEKAKQLGWVPPITLDEGLKEALEM